MSLSRACFIALSGVVLPLVTLAFEMYLHISADVLFDPVPTPAHVALVASVPLSLMAGCFLLRRSQPRDLDGAALLCGWAQVISISYSLLYLPFMPFAIIAILYFGAGFLPLAPVMSLLAACSLRVQLTRSANVRGFGRGALLALAVLAALELRPMLTRVGLVLAANRPVGSGQGPGLALTALRAMGDRETLRAYCDPGGRREFAFAQSLFGSVSAERAREIFFLATGADWQAEPSKRNQMRHRAENDQWAWDPDRGELRVGSRRPKLTLARSSLNGRVDPDAAVAYIEWTLEFQNDGKLEQEARGVVELPPGAVVSRVTLWVDGQPREAAFAGRAKAEAAYQAVVRQRRDPLLVSHAGADRVLVQCFPVPAGGGMKIRLGMSVPLVPGDSRHAALILPRFVERNYAFDAALRHELSIESSGLLTLPPTWQSLPAAGGRQLLSASIDDSQLKPGQGVITVPSAPERHEILVPDPIDPLNWSIRQEIAATVQPETRQVYLVVDASASMDSALPALARAMASIPGEVKVALIAADDGPARLRLPLQSWSEVEDELTRQVRRLSASGGRDNLPALALAWERAAAQPGSIVIWIYGDAPVALTVPTGLVQRLARKPDGPLVISIPASSGVNSLEQALHGQPRFERLVRAGDLETDLVLLFQSLDRRNPVRELRRERVPAMAGPPWPGSDAKIVSDLAPHVARLWVADEVRRIVTTDPERATSLASQTALVTAATSAVVLATVAEHNAAGLVPVPAGSIPTVPEPAEWLLLIVVTVLLAATLHARLRRGSGAPTPDAI